MRPRTSPPKICNILQKIANSAKVYVCGNNSSVAGLTAAVHREGGDFAVEAGALVLADP